MFDFDNTLVDFHQASKLAFDQCFIDYDIEQKSNYYEVYGVINAGVWKDFEDKKISAVDIRKIRFTKFLEQIGVNHLDGLTFNAQYLNNLIKFTTIRPEVVEMLKVLKEKYKLSIITNGLKEVQRPRLDQCQITDLFDSIIVSDEINVAKPDKEFFDIAIASIDEEISKDKILVIGDNLRSDIAGAQSYGLKSCYLNRDPNTNTNADMFITDVLQLSAVLEDIYVPVDCGWYDYLEIYSMKKMEVEILYNIENRVEKTRGKITTLRTKNKEEFAILSDGNQIRLDKIINVKVL